MVCDYEKMHVNRRNRVYYMSEKKCLTINSQSLSIRRVGNKTNFNGRGLKHKHYINFTNKPEIKIEKKERRKERKKERKRKKNKS